MNAGGCIDSARAEVWPQAGVETVRVRVRSDSGVEGIGEAFGSLGIARAACSAFDSMIAPRCAGIELAATRELPESIRRALYGASANGPFAYALSGLEIALWDLRGKLAGRPVHELLGSAGELRPWAMPRVDACGRDADLVQAPAMVLACSDPDAIETMARACEGRGQRLAVDAGCAWNVHEATTILRRLRKLDPLWVADPVWPPEDSAALSVLRARCGVPLAGGWHAASLSDIERRLASGCWDIAELDVTRIGGIDPFVRLARMALRQGLALCARVAGPGPGLLATLHACASLGVAVPIACPADVQVGGAPAAGGGTWPLPTGPGLGLP